MQLAIHDVILWREFIMAIMLWNEGGRILNSGREIINVLTIYYVNQLQRTAR